MRTSLLLFVLLLYLNYSCSLEDTNQASGCIGGMILEAVQLEAATCGGMDGSVKIQVIGNIGEPVYSLDGGPTQRFGTFENLAPGTYKAIVTDDAGCAAETEAIITTGLVLADVKSIIQTNCVEGCHDGTASSATPLLNLANETTILNNTDLILTQISAMGIHEPDAIDLDEPDFELLKCWIADGAPE